MTRGRGQASPRRARASVTRRVLGMTGWTLLVAVSWFVTYAVLVLGGR